MQVDMANKLREKHTSQWIEADSWINAYKATLSGNKIKEFEKEWNKLESEYDRFQKGRTKADQALNPLNI